ncbi:MAG: hypothetical protein JNL79_04190 [Myxococcales bacterium]|nr:hypothetical protein [Myxococcales bacterium]
MLDIDTIPMQNPSRASKAVYTIVDRPGSKSIWVHIGWAHINHDGSFNLHLDALPLNGKLQVRDWTPRDQAAPRRDERRDERRDDLRAAL